MYQSAEPKISLPAAYCFFRRAMVRIVTGCTTV